MLEKNCMKPFIKWAGGKTQILEILQENFPEEKQIRYIEPFIGGGALFFEIAKNNIEYKFKEIIINDINPKLINVYRVLKESLEELLENLELLEKEYIDLNSLEEKEKMFYEIRKEFNSNMLDKEKEASYFIFLNKTCYNGLYRENSKGGFNVPFGKREKPSLYDKKILKEISKFLNLKNEQGEYIVKIYNKNYLKLEKEIDSDTFIYFDPPYRPITKSGFNSYSKSGFNDNDQIELSKFCKKIDEKGAKFLLSNSDPKNYEIEDNFFDELYSEFKIKRIFAIRNINSKANGRGKVNELLIKNY